MTKTTVRVNDRRPASGTVTLAPKGTGGSTSGGNSSRANKSGLAAVLPIHPGPGSKLDPASSTMSRACSNQAVAPDPILAETAHDLNNALNAIRLHLDLLALECGNAERVRHRLQQIQPAIQHATEIALQFMDPKGLNPERANERSRQTALNPVLQRMVPILSAMLPPSVTLHLRLAPDLEVVAIDPVQVVRIVSNLVLNSCAALTREANPAGGQVTIETDHGRVAGWVALRVRDTGSGMSATTQAKLFRPFFTTKPRRENAGLGLASVLRMVLRAGGTIQVDSAPGDGTDIAILFPSAGSRHRKKLQPSRLAQSMVAQVGNARLKSGPQRSSR